MLEYSKKFVGLCLIKSKVHNRQIKAHNINIAHNQLKRVANQIKGVSSFYQMYTVSY
jgi:IS1 family transposase